MLLVRCPLASISGPVHLRGRLRRIMEVARRVSTWPRIIRVAVCAPTIRSGRLLIHAVKSLVEGNLELGHGYRGVPNNLLEQRRRRKGCAQRERCVAAARAAMATAQRAHGQPHAAAAAATPQEAADVCA